MQHLDAGDAHEGFGIDVGRAARAEGAVGNRARLGLRHCDQFLQVVGRERRAGNQCARHADQVDHPGEILHRVIGQLVVEVLIGRKRGVGRHVQGVAVCRRLRHGFGGDDGVGARAILRDHRMAPDPGEFLTESADQHVRQPTRWERDDDLHRLGRKGLRRRATCKQRERQRCEYGPDLAMIHVSLLWICWGCVTTPGDRVRPRRARAFSSCRSCWC